MLVWSVKTTQKKTKQNIQDKNIYKKENKHVTFKNSHRLDSVLKKKDSLV